MQLYNYSQETDTEESEDKELESTSDCSKQHIISNLIWFLFVLLKL